MNFDEPIQNLIDLFSRLPGVGERSALRMAIHLLKSEKELCFSLADGIREVAEKIRECASCCMVTSNQVNCRICESPTRDRSILCIVATIQDLVALEMTGDFRGIYHVLHGTLAPMEGIGPHEIRIRPLFSRLTDGLSEVKEVILATPPNVEGEATAIYLLEQLKQFSVKTTRIASGVPVGGDLQYSDRLTLSRALSLRRGY